MQLRCVQNKDDAVKVYSFASNLVNQPDLIGWDFHKSWMDTKLKGVRYNIMASLKCVYCSITIKTFTKN
jgi:hypothetical protein